MSRWDDFITRAKSTYRAAAAVDAAQVTLQQALLDLQNDPGGAASPAVQRAAGELRQALQALPAAREALREALRERVLTPSSREPAFWGEKDTHHGA